MRFTPEILAATAKRFRQSLRETGLKLAFTASNDVWAEMLGKKSYPAAMAEARTAGHISVAPATTDEIIKLLAARHRVVSRNVALALITEPLRPLLASISEGLASLVSIIEKYPDTCLIPIYSDPSTGLGLIDADRPGYFPVYRLNCLDLDEAEWSTKDRFFAAELINLLGGKSLDRVLEIDGGRHRTARNVQNKTFARFVGSNKGELSKAISKAVFELYSSDPDPSFDDIRGAVEEAFELETRRCKEQWLDPFCELAESTADHVAAALRRHIQHFAEEDEESNSAQHFFDPVMLSLTRQTKPWVHEEEAEQGSIT